MLLMILTEVEVAKHTVSTGQLIPHTEHKTKPEQHPSSKCPQNRWRPDRWCGGGLVWGGSQGHGRLDRLVFAAASITNRLRVAPCLRLLTPHNLSMLAPLSPHTLPHYHHTPHPPPPFIHTTAEEAAFCLARSQPSRG